MKNLDELSKAYAAGRISRRTFMQGAVAMGATIAAASSMAVRAEAATPNKGGTLRMGQGHGSTTDSLDPATYENGFSQGLCYGAGNHLTEVDNTGELVPELAESYESSDATTWVFKVRKGVEFHNGKTMTGQDIVDSFNHHRGEDSKSAAKGLLTAVKELKVDGDNVVFVLESANADFPFIVSDYHFKICPSNGDGTIDWQSGVGTGGYKLESFEPGVKAEYTRFPNYWKEGRAHFDSVVQRSIIDPTARQNALMNGEVDVIDRVDPKTVDLLSRVPIVKILETTGTLHYTFPMRLDTPPFDNYDLRMALKLAVKRQELVDKILLGHGALGNDVPLSPAANRYFNKDMPQREFDADAAAAHYKKSGHSGPIQLSASDAAFGGAVDAAQLIKASAAEAGIEIEVVREPSDGYWSNVWNKKGWCASYWGGRPTEDWMFSAAYTDDTEWNDTAWKDTDAAKKFNELVRAARSELDDVKRRAMYYEAQVLLNDDGGALIPMFANNIMGLNQKVMHADDVAANWDLDGGKAMERWWFG